MNLIEAGKNPDEASDGNMYKLNQQCPSCRAKFCVPLLDVVILRESERHKALKNKADSELSAKDLRKKHDNEINSRLEAAEERYRDGVLALNDTYIPKSNTSDGVMKIDNSLSEDEDEQQKKKMDLLDSMLFCGLHDSMTESERTYVKELITGGSTTKLMQAAYILASIADMNRNGGTPLTRQMRNDLKLRKTRSTPDINVHRSAMPRMSSNTGATVLAHNPTELQSDIMNRDKLKKLYPIPIRMPKAINLQLDFDIHSTKSPITFIDDEKSFEVLRNCDDVRSKLIRDAYMDLTFGLFGKLVRREPYNSAGVDNILSGLDICDDAPSIKIPWRRVVVASVKGQAVRSGLRAGDVITFVDGEEFEGNAEKLKFLFAHKREYSLDGDENPTIHIICNAEAGIAEALRVRQILAESQKEPKDNAF